MTVHGHIKKKLQAMGYPSAHAKAIIAIAEVSEACGSARKWWHQDMALLAGEAAALEVLWENVRRIAARYAVAFLGTANLSDAG